MIYKWNYRFYNDKKYFLNIIQTNVCKMYMKQTFIGVKLTFLCITAMFFHLQAIHISVYLFLF